MKITQHFSRHTLSGKLLLLFIVIALLVMLLVGGSMQHIIREHFKVHIRPNLLQYLSYVQQDIGYPPSRQRAKQLATELNVDILIQDQQGYWSSHGQQIDLDNIQIKHHHIVGDSRLTVGDTQYALIEVENKDKFFMVDLGDARLFFGIPQQERDLHSRIFFSLFMLLIILSLLYYATRRLFAPLQTIRAGVQRFGTGELDHRISIKRRDELGELASSFNTMADDIQQMLEAKRQLLLAISHELRSPLTRTKVATELLDDAEQQQRLHRDLNEIEKLIEELLETERLSTPHRVLNRAPHAMNTLISQVIDDFYKEANIQFAPATEEITLDVDAARIKLLLKNLIDNALRHSPSDKPIAIHLQKTSNDIELQIRDEGEGIEAEYLPHLTEPFYRVDPSRQRETGGYGLGLYLCRMIVEAHGGTLSIESQKQQGTSITIRLPF
ncbi:MAG: ATP-binding protein [Gammaproteobacteria bacterium]|nr:ATP-binding protein [Gammaproteobacteria bacterium]